MRHAAARNAVLRNWLIVFGLAMGTAVSNGYARFAYGLILPAMRTDLGWTYTQAGWINTANAIGYLIGALLALATIRRLGAAFLFNAGMVLMTLSLLATALSTDLATLTFWRILAGIGGSPVFIAGGALAATLFREDPQRNALAIALSLAGGGGMGMLLAGATLPLLLERWGAGGWPSTWLLLGAISAASLPLSWWAVRASQAPVAGAEAKRAEVATARVPMRASLAALGSYALFGAGYIVYVTFLVAWMRDNGAGPALVATAWALLSAMVIASPLLWRRVLASARGGGAMALASGVTGVAMLLPLALPGMPGVLASAALFGASFFIVPSAATGFARKNFPPSQWGAAMAGFTVVFSVGQIIGPVAAGALADRAGGVSVALAIGGVVLLAGAVCGWLQRSIDERIAGPTAR